MTDAKTKAAEIAQAIAALKLDGLRPRTWAPECKDWARVYTGAKDEYFHVSADGDVTSSRLNMTWGHKISDVVEYKSA